MTKVKGPATFPLRNVSVCSAPSKEYADPPEVKGAPEGWYISKGGTPWCGKCRAEVKRCK